MSSYSYSLIILTVHLIVHLPPTSYRGLASYSFLPTHVLRTRSQIGPPPSSLTRQLPYITGSLSCDTKLPASSTLNNRNIKSTHAHITRRSALPVPASHILLHTIGLHRQFPRYKSIADKPDFLQRQHARDILLIEDSTFSTFLALPQIPHQSPRWYRH